MIDIAKLAADVKKALDEACAEVGDNAQDIGTCNFDALLIPVGKGESIARRSKKVEDILTSAGLSFWFADARYTRGYVINPDCRYQGGPRTRIVQAAHKKLTSWGVSIYYQVD